MKTTNQIVVAVEPGATLRGSVRAQAFEDRPFEGWLGLLSALQAAIGDMRGDA